MGVIENHTAPQLSALDLTFARAVPPGGNWKNIPASVPSQRLKQIRASCARGEGSRSTYYGRLRAEDPAYTISTYFGRPGNGCHLHFDASQDRTLSYREAARLQSFPDAFVFCGSKSAVAKQIGNAVPPLLAFCLAKAFGRPGYLVDLFAGAGGLSLGFGWAGWTSIVASDIQDAAMRTYARNIHANVVVGDIRAAAIRAQIAAHVAALRRPSEPLVLVGGPPCQGFSTAGHRRSMEDARNHLFEDYCSMVDAVNPDAFLFENVPGLLSMEGGAVFARVLAALRQVAREVHVWRVSADAYGVPQRRKRVILVGFRRRDAFELMAAPLSGRRISVEEALGDLPRLAAGEDGTQLGYRGAARGAYQQWMRGEMDATQFVATLAHRGGL